MRLGALILASVLTALSGLAWAQDAGAARPARREESKACEYAAHHTPDSVRRLLALYPRGGDMLTFAVYSAVIERPASAWSMVSIANLASPPQIAAIARGLLQALERLDTFNPQCLAACPNQGGSVGDNSFLSSQPPTGENGREDNFDNQNAAYRAGQCGAPVRAALHCAEPSVDAVMAALAEQGFALADASVAGHCNAPIYAGAHNFSGWSVTASPRVSRN